MASQTDQIDPKSENNDSLGANRRLSDDQQEKSQESPSYQEPIDQDSNVVEEYEPASCMQQTIALVRKNFLNKMRTPVGTVLELVSPALFILILVLGYSLSEEEFVEVGKYDEWEFDLPNQILTGALLGVLSEGIGDSTDLPGNLTFNSFAGRRNLLEEKVSQFDFLFDYDSVDEEDALEDKRVDNSMNHLFQWKNVHQLSRMLQSGNETEEENSNDDDVSGFQEVGDSLNGLRRELRRLLRSPFPIPTLPQYLTLSQTLSTQFNADELDLVYQRSDFIRRWGNLLTLGTIHLSPRSDIVDEFIQYLGDVHNIQNISSSTVLEDRPNATSVLLRVHDDAEAATNYVMDNLNERTFVAIHFDDDEDNNMKYTMRMNSTTLPNTNLITRWVSIGLSMRFERYFFSGHLTLQRTVNEFAVWRASNSSSTLQSNNCEVPDTSAWDVFTMPMPTPAYSQNPFFTAVGFLLGLVMAMSFLYPVSRLIKAMVEEKESRMKETLFILGVRPLAQWMSWIITATISSIIVSLLATLTLKGVMIHSSFFYLFIYILLFSFAVSGFAFFISAFFSRANLAAIIGPVALFITLLPRWIFFGTNRYEATVSKKWASILPCTAFAFGADILSDYEYAQVGIQADNLNDGYYNFNTALGFLFLDTILYIALGWYLEQVIPRQYGVAKKWYFPFTPSFWKEALRVGSDAGDHDETSHGFGDSTARDIEDGTVEAVPSQAKLNIRNLVKIYNPKKPPAINNLNLSMYESEITCLLGHNGAGKSSTISVLTGLYPPTSGDCVVYGKSILRDMVQCRQSMGICPQQNVLFNNLTVLEHLRFFESIKGVSSSNVEDRAREVGLGEFFHTRAGQLSGGNKRKLQLAIALAGAPKLVLLDEPTSGMDPYSRRATWELLRQKRRDRIILLTTHFMDEAEVLADRVAILKEGSLQCCGSVMFLKQRFGLGYNITVMIEKMDEKGEVTMKDVQKNVSGLLEKYVPGTRFIRESARELVYRFPPGSEPCFPSLFDALEKGGSEYHLSSYGVSNTSLEEVFLELAENDATKKDSVEVSSRNLFAQKQSLKHQEKYLGAISQVSLLIHKRYTIQRRDLKGLFFKVVLPVILICLVLFTLMVDIPIKRAAIDLSADLYKTSSSGASIGNSMIVAGSKLNQKESFMTTVNGTYPSVDVTTNLDLANSADVSNYILFGLQENHKLNFGSFVFGDTINIGFNVNWTQLKMTSFSRNDGNNTTSTMSQTNTEVQSTSMVSKYPSNDMNASNLVNSIIRFTNSSSKIPNESNLLMPIDKKSVNEAISKSLSTLVNRTINYLFSHEDTLGETFMKYAFGDKNNLTIGGDQWSAMVTKETAQSLFNTENVTYNMTIKVPSSIIHNSSSAHSVAAFTQTYYDYLYKKCTTTLRAKLSAINHPLPPTSQQSTERRILISLITSNIITLPYIYIPAAFAVFVVKERACKSKHLQLVSGVDMLAYWISTYIWDFTMFILLAVIAMLGFVSFGDVSVVFTGSIDAFCCTILSIIGFGLSSLPFAYLISRLFDDPLNAQLSTMIIFFVTGFLAMTTIYILESVEALELVSILKPMFRTWPAYNLGEAFLKLASNFWEQQITSNAPSPFSWNACGRPLFFLYTLSLPYFLWLMFLEFSSDGGSGGRLGKLMRGVRTAAHRLHNRQSGFTQVTPNDTDDDVLEEERIVREGGKDMAKTSPVVIGSLWKVFPKGSLLSVIWGKLISSVCCCMMSSGSDDNDKAPKVAVHDLSLHVDNGITMGLLGVNGAGKTTTMGILTGDITPTSGEAYVAGNDVTGRTQDGVQLARKNIGFCPQVDPLLDLMTGRETLSMFGRLRGIPVDVLDDVVDDLIDKLTLTPHADKVSQNYSGGNKRKLSLGVALIGNPKVLFIDESSSGMDPSARRKIWDLLSEAAKDRAVVLTTHSMEEAEALCNKVAIMIQGRIRCLGGVQHLKQKFLGGYTVSLSCEGSASEEDIDVVESKMMELLPLSSLSERHGGYLKYEVNGFGNEGDGGLRSLGELFGSLQELVESDKIRVGSYSVSQCTLEQVFINLVKEGATNSS